MGCRHIPIGRLDKVTDGVGCYLVGDAAGLPNPLCFGGIGAALISARFAAEAACYQKPVSYSRFIERDPMFDRRFMDAHRVVSGCGMEEAKDLLEPFRDGYSIPRGLLAMVRRPRYARAYFGMWRGFRIGWRVCPSIHYLKLCHMWCFSLIAYKDNYQKRALC